MVWVPDDEFLIVASGRLEATQTVRFSWFRVLSKENLSSDAPEVGSSDVDELTRYLAPHYETKRTSRSSPVLPLQTSVQDRDHGRNMLDSQTLARENRIVIGLGMMFPQ